MRYEDTLNGSIEQKAKEYKAKEGVKHDNDKLPEHLASPFAHRRLLEVLRFGAKKYAERNWELGMDWGRVYAAAERHLHAWWSGQDNDPETGLSHLAHAMTCLHFLNHYEDRKIGKDDRPYNAN